MKKRFVIMGGALILALSLSVCALTADEAKAKAEKYVPSDSVYIKTELDEGNYEVEFDRKDLGERYEIKVSQSTDAVVSIKSKKYADQGGKDVKISLEAAKNIVASEQKDAEILYAFLETDDGFSKYQVSFRTGVCYGEYDIHPGTGAILERDIHMGAMPTSTSLVNEQTVTGGIGLDKAKEIALARVSEAQIEMIELDEDDGRMVYEGELRNGDWEYEFQIDASTGALLEWEQDYDD